MMIRKMIAATALALGAAGAVALAPAASAATGPLPLTFAGVYPSVSACLHAGDVGKSQKRWSYFHCTLLAGNQGGLWVQ
jgi:hypothetical protein